MRGVPDATLRTLFIVPSCCTESSSSSSSSVTSHTSFTMDYEYIQYQTKQRLNEASHPPYPKKKRRKKNEARKIGTSRVATHPRHHDTLTPSQDFAPFLDIRQSKPPMSFQTSILALPFACSRPVSLAMQEKGFSPNTISIVCMLRLLDYAVPECWHYGEGLLEPFIGEKG